MRFIRALIWIVVIFGLGLTAVWFLAPREPVDMSARFDATRLSGGIDTYLIQAEANVPNLRAGTAKHVVWAGEAEAKTPLSIVYVHGFSASLQEIRPVPDLVAQALGANLYYTRLAGHARDGDAMAEPRVADWAADMAEAIAIGQAIGDRVIVMSTSTGAALATLATLPGGVAHDIAGHIMVSPNFQVTNPAATILTWPGVRLWGPAIAGEQRVWEPLNPDHGRFWTTSYPTVAAIPMGAMVKAARDADVGTATVPVLCMCDPRDQVVDHTTTQAVAAAWGGDVTMERLSVGPGDDPYFHVITGDILSPGQTQRAADIMTEWIKGLN